MIHILSNKIIKDIGSRFSEIVLVAIGHHKAGGLSMNGFAYYKDGLSIMVAPRDFEILDIAEGLRKSMSIKDKRLPWVACIFRVRPSTKSIEIEFEYKDAERWRITFQNSKERSKKFCPAIHPESLVSSPKPKSQKTKKPTKKSPT